MMTTRMTKPSMQRTTISVESLEEERESARETETQTHIETERGRERHTQRHYTFEREVDMHDQKRRRKKPHFFVLLPE